MDKLRDTHPLDNYKIVLNYKRASHALPQYHIMLTGVGSHDTYNFETVTAQAATCLERIIGIHDIKGT